MYVQARDMHYQMAGMKMDTAMATGMVAIVIGLVITGYGLLPRHANYGSVARLHVARSMTPPWAGCTCGCCSCWLSRSPSM